MASENSGVDAWKEHASAFDRVRSVAQTVSEPRSAGWIAERAAVSENTARDHLERLVELNVLLAVEGGGVSTYRPDPLHTRLQTVRELLESHDRDGLIEVKADLQRQIEAWRQEYDVESPEELRDLAAETTGAAETRAVREAANDWELATYRLEVVEDAIENYATYSRGDLASA